MRTPLPSVSLLLALAAAACAVEDAGTAPPTDALHFPGAAVLGDGGRRLYVVSMNFDLRYRSGVLHVFDRETIDTLADATLATEPGRPGRTSSFGDGLLSAVEIGDFGGVPAVANVGGNERVFVPMRGDDSVLAVDVAPDGKAYCANGGGQRCADSGVNFAGDDPGTAAVLGGHVFVVHETAQTLTGLIGTAPIDAPMFAGEGGRFRTLRLGSMPLGGISARCAATGCADGGTLFVSGRSTEDLLDPIFALEVTAAEPFGALTARNAYYQHRGFDSRGVAVSPSGDFVYVLTRAPDAVAQVDVRPLPTAGPTLCLVDPASPYSCADRLAAVVTTEPPLRTVRTSGVPRRPTSVVAIPRPGVGDLLAIATGKGLALVDTRTGSVAAALPDVGGTASAPAFFVRADGSIRLYVPSFDFGTIAVVDVADPLRPQEARVVALLGAPQEETF